MREVTRLGHLAHDPAGGSGRYPRDASTAVATRSAISVATLSALQLAALCARLNGLVRGRPCVHVSCGYGQRPEGEVAEPAM